VNEFASRYAVHVIFDEVYAESLLPGVRHYSGLRLASPWVHVVYGFAKDFGLSGYKVGILHTENPEVLQAAKDSAYFHTVSTLTQRVLAGVLASPRLEEFFAQLRARLDASFRQATGELTKGGIPFVTAQGGILLWIDLRAFLPAASFAGERELCDRILRDCRVNISPGQAFHCSEPGWFRLCFTTPESHRREGLRRLVDGLIEPGVKDSSKPST
jgi:aspartate/methionine/tyrosine aminotransferase